MTETTAGPSHPITISGTTVGLLDPSQSFRLLSTPLSKLSFATFHPLTASNSSRSLSAQDELCNAKRIVIEVLPNGQSFWRWVPRAKGVDMSADEGVWPRLINVCGQLVMCSRDQWDIYKLDPEYDCVVRPEPEMTTITRREKAQTSAQEGSSSKLKRPHPEDNSDDELPMPGNMKKSKPATVETESDDDSDSDDEVESLIDRTPAKTSRSKVSKEEREKLRRSRREKNAARARKLEDIQEISMIDLTIDENPRSSATYSQPPSYTSNPFSQPPSYSQPPSFSQPSYPPTSASTPAPQPPLQGSPSKRPTDAPEENAPKRQRTRSPTSMRTLWTKKKDERARFRQGKYNQKLAQMKAARDRAFVEDLRASVPPETFFTQSTSEESSNGTSGSTSANTPPTEPEPVPAEDPVSLEEKIRRVQEINAFERARREKEEARLFAERAEAERKRKAEEGIQRERERAERQRREREQERRRREQQQQEEEFRRRREEEARRRQEQTRREQERFSYGSWTPQRALERYKTLAEAFDAAKFTAESPITFMAVPWPVLHKPNGFTVEDVDWASVEAFFTAVRRHMRPQDYKVFVEKSHRRFHPDRWRARRVLQSVQDDELRECLEVAANTVAQALTPIWSEAKST